MSRYAYILTFLLLGSILPAFGQGETTAEGDATDDVFTEAVDVNVINVEVFVTDKAGKRILGLTRDDFELTVDRKPIPFSYFYPVEGGKVRPNEAPKPKTEISVQEPVQPRVAAAMEVPEEQRLSLVVYVDNYNIDPLHRNRLFSHVRNFLRSHLQPSDRVMLVSYDRELHTRLAFTSDPGLLSEALFDLEEFTGLAPRANDERRDLLDAIYEEANPDPANNIVARADAHAQALFNDLQFTIEALKEIVETLAGLPGRKAVLYLSNGIAMRAGEDIFYAMQERWNDSRFLMQANRYDASRRFQELTARANSHRVSFYTIDAAGLRPYTYNDASNSSPTGGVAIDEAHFANLQSPLQFMAEETGGLAIINTSRFGPKLDQVAGDFDTYYSLGFTPAPEDARYRRIEVKVKGRKGLTVRHREGYRNKPTATRMTDGTLAALYHGYQRNPLGVVLEIGNGTLDKEDSAKKDFFLVPVVVKIPIGELAFLPQQEMHRGRLRLYVAGQDTGGGGSSAVQEISVPIDIPSADIEHARTKLYHHRFTLRMRRGRQLLAVGVYDEIGGERNFVVRGAEVGA